MHFEAIPSTLTYYRNTAFIHMVKLNRKIVFNTDFYAATILCNKREGVFEFVAPFNLVKGIVVSILTFLLYKRISGLLHGTGKTVAAKA